jgi:hypothetical protein
LIFCVLALLHCIDSNCAYGHDTHTHSFAETVIKHLHYLLCFTHTLKIERMKRRRWIGERGVFIISLVTQNLHCNTIYNSVTCTLSKLTNLTKSKPLSFYSWTLKQKLTEISFSNIDNIGLDTKISSSCISYFRWWFIFSRRM